jgi:hypothetical protein
MRESYHSLAADKVFVIGSQETIPTSGFQREPDAADTARKTEDSI